MFLKVSAGNSAIRKINFVRLLYSQCSMRSETRRTEKKFHREVISSILNKAETKSHKISDSSPNKNQKRKCSTASTFLFQAPCCYKVYHCRHCHNEKEDHTLDRREITVIQCAHCNMKQQCGKICSSCGIEFGKYTCLICRLYDNEDKQQFHCDQCGICRVGGRENYFHCKKCNTCLNLNISSSHKCIENVSRTDCSICLQDLHTSVKGLTILRCGHMMHEECKDLLSKRNFLKCPTCLN